MNEWMGFGRSSKMFRTTPQTIKLQREFGDQNFSSPKGNLGIKIFLPQVATQNESFEQNYSRIATKCINQIIQMNPDQNQISSHPNRICGWSTFPPSRFARERPSHSAKGGVAITAIILNNLMGEWRTTDLIRFRDNGYGSDSYEYMKLVGK